MIMSMELSSVTPIASTHTLNPLVTGSVPSNTPAVNLGIAGEVSYE